MQAFPLASQRFISVSLVSSYGMPFHLATLDLFYIVFVLFQVFILCYWIWLASLFFFFSAAQLLLSMVKPFSAFTMQLFIFCYYDPQKSIEQFFFFLSYSK